MKWSVFGLILVGVVAALAAALLVGVLSKRNQPTTQPAAQGPATSQPVETTILLAARPLPLMAVVDRKAVTTRSVAVENAPAGGLSDPAQAIGMMVRIPMAEGQPFTRDCLVKPPAASIPDVVQPGRRAFSLSPSDYGGLEGLLRPGYRVDVLATFKVARVDGGEDFVSMTLLQDVPVLAIEDRTIVSPEGSDKSAAPRAASSKPMITLMVDPVEAQKLQLAQEHGLISLAIRNPKDLDHKDRQPIPISKVLPAPVEPETMSASAPWVSAGPMRPAPVVREIEFIQGGAVTKVTVPQ